MCKTIESMTPEVLERQTRVVTIAFGLDADPALEDLALKSGGEEVISSTTTADLDPSMMPFLVL